MSYRSSNGWFWPNFDDVPAPPGRSVAAERSATPPPARFDRWAQPAPPPFRRSGVAHERAAAAPDAATDPALTRASG